MSDFTPGGLIVVAKRNTLYLVAVPKTGGVFAICDDEPGYAAELARLAGELSITEADLLARLKDAAGRGPSVLVGGVSYYVSEVPF